jgi:hypothetical protein
MAYTILLDIPESVELPHGGFRVDGSRASVRVFGNHGASVRASRCLACLAGSLPRLGCCQCGDQFIESRSLSCAQVRQAADHERQHSFSMNGKTLQMLRKRVRVRHSGNVDLATLWIPTMPWRFAVAKERLACYGIKVSSLLFACSAIWHQIQELCFFPARGCCGACANRDSLKSGARESTGWAELADCQATCSASFTDTFLFLFQNAELRKEPNGLLPSFLRARLQ